MKVNAKHFNATGRRKSAVARVFLQEGSGQIVVNGRPLKEYFNAVDEWVFQVLQPLDVVGANDRFDVIATVKGGGNTGQAGAIRLGVARALDSYEFENLPAGVKEALAKAEAQPASDEDGDSDGGVTLAEAAADEEEAPTGRVWHKKLRAAGCLTRDPRVVLRKNVGLVKARKAKQFSKR